MDRFRNQLSEKFQPIGSLQNQLLKTIPIYGQHPITIVQTIEINRQSPKSLVRTFQLKDSLRTHSSGHFQVFESTTHQLVTQSQLIDESPEIIFLNNSNCWKVADINWLHSSN